MRGRAWTTGERRRLYELRDAGVAVRDIAPLLGRTEDALWAFMRGDGRPYRRRRPLPRQSPCDRLRDATIRAIFRRAYSSGVDIDTAARALLSEGVEP